MNEVESHPTFADVITAIAHVEEIVSRTTDALALADLRVLRGTLNGYALAIKEQLELSSFVGNVTHAFENTIETLVNSPYQQNIMDVQKLVLGTLNPTPESAQSSVMKVYLTLNSALEHLPDLYNRNYLLMESVERAKFFALAGTVIPWFADEKDLAYTTKLQELISTALTWVELTRLHTFYTAYLEALDVVETLLCEAWEMCLAEAPTPETPAPFIALEAVRPVDCKPLVKAVQS